MGSDIKVRQHALLRTFTASIADECLAGQEQRLSRDWLDAQRAFRENNLQVFNPFECYRQFRVDHRIDRQRAAQARVL